MYFRGKACSKNNSLLERVYSRVQHIWRLRLMAPDLPHGESIDSREDHLSRVSP